MSKVAIIGAGISGLFIANLFKKDPNYQVTIYEKNSAVALEEGYGVQLSVNSIKLLNKIGFTNLQPNEKFTPEKINFYSDKSLNKICELSISAFNTEDCKYTTMKRSTLINFLKRDIREIIKTGYNISEIEQKDKQIKLSFENNEIKECDYLIISDGVFSKSKSIISNKQNQPKYNNTVAIRGVVNNLPENIDNKNISLFLGSNFHQVVYPINSHGDLNFIAIMKYPLTFDEQNKYSLFNENFFIKRVLDKVPQTMKDVFDNVNNIRIFPVFISDNFYKIKNNKIHLIGDAFFAFPPSFAQGASQSIEGAYELFINIQNNTENNFFQNRVKKTKMVNMRSKLNQFAFHLSNPVSTSFRNLFLKRLVKNRKFLESYLGKIYRS